MSKKNNQEKKSRKEVSEEIRQYRVKVYLSKAEARMAKRQAKNQGLSVPDYLEMLITRRRTG